MKEHGVSRRTFVKASATAALGLQLVPSRVLGIDGKTTPSQDIEPSSLSESPREIPVAYEVDVVVVGGTFAGIAAAVEAARGGAKVFLAAPRSYLGEDVCGTYRYWLEQGETPESPLARSIYAVEPGGKGRLPTPMHVKKSLDQALLAAGVQFLYNCYVTEVLVDPAGNPAGVVLANRSGRQAVKAKIVIDASPRAAVARMAGAQFSAYPAGEQVFHHVVLGGEPRKAPGGTVRTIDGQAQGGGALFEYTLRIPMEDGRFASFARAEQIARDATFHPGQLDAGELLFQVPPDSMTGVKRSEGAWNGVAALELDAFKPEGISRLYVAGGCADISRQQAARLLRPLACLELGTRIGEVAAKEAKGLPAVQMPLSVKAVSVGGTVVRGEVKEVLAGIRPVAKPSAKVASPERSLPVLGLYDVVVIGGGTGGAAAGIGAGRGGTKTLIVEQQCALGGVGTLGLINTYWFGYRGGFTRDVDDGAERIGARNKAIGKAEWWRRENRKAGVELWFGAIGCGAVVERGVVRGVVVVTPQGRGIVLARTVIDATGNADVAAAAGAECSYTAGDDVGVQGAGLPPIKLGANYTNTDWTFADDTDVVDFWHHFVLARIKFPKAYDLGTLMDTRERRRIVGDVVVSPMDIVLKRTWPDTLVQCRSNFDSHGFTIHPLFFAMPPDHAALEAYVPFRALLPKGMDGLLVTGLGVSAHRDAMPVIRMQPDVQNQGYACGWAGAMVAKGRTTIRNLDIRELQRHLIEVQCLPESVLTDKDSLPVPPAEVEAAVRNVVAKKSTAAAGKRSTGKTAPGKAGGAIADGVVHNARALAILFAQPKDSVPLLKQAYATATGDSRLAYAHILAMLGDGEGLETLLERVQSSREFDKGWNYKGMGQFGRSVSELDSYIIALGRIGDRRAVDVILEKTRLLDAKHEFSHHRACAMALEQFGDRQAAEVLASVLMKPGMTGHAWKTLAESQNKVPSSATDNVQRNESLRELVLARALYRCGDKEGLGEKILRQYAQDLRGHYARHATAVLNRE